MANKPIKTAPHHSPRGNKLKPHSEVYSTPTGMEQRKTRKYQVLGWEGDKLELSTVAMANAECAG